jgi:hypothetical protein
LLSRAAAWPVAVTLAVAPACGDAAGPPSASALEPVAAAALGYLESTNDELGIDVVVSLQIYAGARASTRAEALASMLTGGLRASDVERYGALLSLDKGGFPASLLDGVPASGAPVLPADTREDDLGVRCPLDALACRLDDACRAFVLEPDRGGYVATHQALLLLFWRWAGCPADAALEGGRRPLGARLVQETAADPSGGDLFLERLAMIGHLGFAAHIEDPWWEQLAAMQRPEGCFPASPTIPCHPHPTGLALWALAHAP